MWKGEREWKNPLGLLENPRGSICAYKICFISTSWARQLLFLVCKATIVLYFRPKGTKHLSLSEGKLRSITVT